MTSTSKQVGDVERIVKTDDVLRDLLDRVAKLEAKKAK